MARIELTRRDYSTSVVGTTVTSIVERPTGHLTFVFAAVLASRVPFLLMSPGAGPDVDASRLVLAGRALAATGHYHLSRNPGYPLVELVAAALASTPVAVLVGLTAVVGAAGAAAFADLLRTLEVRAWIPLTVAYAATPLVWLSDLTFMDYGWAQGAAMVALALLARRRFVGCGVALGLAGACRPAALVLAVVVVVVLVVGRERRDVWLRVGAPLVALVAGGQLLPLLSLGPLYMRFVDQSVPWWVAAGRMSTGVWGWAGTAAIGAGAVVAVAARRRADPWPPEHRAWEIACLVGVGAMVAMFLRLPVDAGYLLPAVPLVLVLLGTVLPTRAVAVLAGALLLSSLYAPGPKALGLSVPEATAQRRAEHAHLAALAATARDLRPGAVLAVGKDLPRLLVLLPEARGEGLEYDLGWNPVPARAVLPGGVVVVNR